MALKLQTDPEAQPDERKAELTEHLAELRTRIIRSALYCGIGMGIMCFVYRSVYNALADPINKAIRGLAGHAGSPGLPGSGLVFTHFTDAFFMMLQIIMIGGLIAAVPFVVMELWGFVSPALTPQEKQGVRFVAPLSVLLFALGVSCAYFVMPMAIHWFLSYVPPGASLLQNPMAYIVFVVKMLLAFGLVFQLPVLLMFLGKVGLLKSSMMKQYWRHISVGLFTFAMIVAPSNDPGTMLALAVPLTLLFLGSIWLVKLVEPKEIQG